MKATTTGPSDEQVNEALAAQGASIDDVNAALAGQPASKAARRTAAELMGHVRVSVVAEPHAAPVAPAGASPDEEGAGVDEPSESPPGGSDEFELPPFEEDDE